MEITMNKLFTFCAVSFAGVFMAFLVWTIVLTIFAIGVERDCLEHGYPGAEVTYDFHGYCINDTLKTVEELK